MFGFLSELYLYIFGIRLKKETMLYQKYDLVQVWRSSIVYNFAKLHNKAYNNERQQVNSKSTPSLLLLAVCLTTPLLCPGL